MKTARCRMPGEALSGSPADCGPSAVPVGSSTRRSPGPVSSEPQPGQHWPAGVPWRRSCMPTSRAHLWTSCSARRPSFASYARARSRCRSWLAPRPGPASGPPRRNPRLLTYDQHPGARLKVVAAAFSDDRKGPLLAGIAEPDRVKSMEHQRLYRVSATLPAETYQVPLGSPESAGTARA